MRPDWLLLVVRGYRTMAYETGTMHGFLYIVYIVVAFAMTRAVRMKIASPATIIVLLAGTIPVLTFVVERWVTRRYITPVMAGMTPSEQPVLR